MKNNFSYKAWLTTCLLVLLVLLGNQNLSAQTYCTQPGSEQFTGEQDGYRYELWNQNGEGTGCMTIGDGARFSGEWSGILNYLARRGLGYNKTQEHQEIGTFYSNYDCDYNPSSASGNSYLSVYGWTVDPLIEYYIVEDWRNWIPSMDDNAISKGTVTVNGSTYEIIKNTRVNQPSIVGTATFDQYFSIRTDKRNSGTINISDHFKAWETLEMDMGKLFEVSFVVEGYKSSGTFNFSELDVYVNNDVNAINDKVSENNNVRIYQDPANGDLSVKLIGTTTNANINVYDTLGKLRFSTNIIDTNVIQIHDLDSGIYIINISGNQLNYKNTILIK